MAADLKIEPSRITVIGGLAAPGPTTSLVVGRGANALPAVFWLQ
jgi:hypothetical protein